MKCRVCYSQFEENAGKLCTPREIAHAPKKPENQGSFDELMCAVNLYSEADTIVVLDNPKDADLPTFQVCSKCLKVYFGIVDERLTQDNEVDVDISTVYMLVVTTIFLSSDACNQFFPFALQQLNQTDNNFQKLYKQVDRKSIPVVKGNAVAASPETYVSAFEGWLKSSYNIDISDMPSTIKKQRIFPFAGDAQNPVDGSKFKWCVIVYFNMNAESSEITKQSIEEWQQNNECPICGDYPERPWMKEIKYACPFCETAVMVRERDIPRGGGVNVLCSSCNRSLRLPAQIWCPQCKNGLVQLDQILQYIAEENGVGIEQLKREGKPLFPSTEELLRINDQLKNLSLFAVSPTKTPPAAVQPPSVPKAPIPAALATPTADREIESKSLSFDNLNPEDQAIAIELIQLGDDNPDIRYKAYNVLDQKHYDDAVLLFGISRIEAEIPSNEVVTRVRLYCGLGVWLGGNIHTRPKGIELIRHAIELSSTTALPHALVGTLLMGDSSNTYLERGTSSFRQHPGLSDGELELLSKKFHSQAQEELELAIRLDPYDPTPYYVFCKSQFLDFSQLKNQYLQGVQRDKTHSPEFGANHWGFAIKAAKFNHASEATDAFLRAMVVSPQEYCEGPRSVRPQGGLALSCWQTAKQQIGSYQGDEGKIDALWLVEQAAESQTAKSPGPEAQPKTPISDPVLIQSAGKTPKRLSASTILRIALGGMILLIGVALFLIAKPFAASGPKPGHWEGAQPFVSFDVTNEGDIVNFILNAPFSASNCKITIENIAVADSKFLVDAKTVNMQEVSMGRFIIQGEFTGATASGTHKIEFCGRTVSFYPEEKVWKAEWKGPSTLPVALKPKSTVAATKAIPTSEPSQTLEPSQTPVQIQPSQTPVQANAAVTYLSQYQPTIIELGYGQYSVGKFNFSSDDPADDIHYGDPIVLHGIEYTHGIFAHAPSRLVYNLGGQHYQEFMATLGLVEKIDCGDGVQFVVLMDGKEIYRSETLYAWSTPVDIQIPVANGSELTLVVEVGSSGNNGCDWGIWGILVYANSQDRSDLPETRPPAIGKGNPPHIST